MWSGVDENQTDSQTAACVFKGSHRPFDALLVAEIGSSVFQITTFSINSKARRSIVECDSLFFSFSSFWKLLLKQSSAEAKTTSNLSSIISLSYSFIVLGFSNLNRRNAQPTLQPDMSIIFYNCL